MLDADRTLALTYVPAKARPSVEALWRLDAALGAVLSTGKEPMISRIKLAWWRDALERLGTERVPDEPVLQALARHILERGVTGADLALMEEGWAVLLEPGALTTDDLDGYAAGRGELLFACSATLLGDVADAGVRSAGRAWALVDLARHSGNEPDALLALERAREQALPAHWPSRLRPLGMLAALAARDAEPARPHLEPQGTPGRMMRMVRHRLTGR